jgi:peptidoglycan/LPS O-acetylase OafA/YrhL
LLPAVFGTARRGLARGLLRLAPVVWLGLISYGIYLWHQGMQKKALEWTDSLVKETEFVRGDFWPVLAITLGLSIVVAALSYYVLERPVLRLKDRRPREPREARATDR